MKNDDEIATTELTSAIIGLWPAADEVCCNDCPETRAAFVTAWKEVMALMPPRRVSQNVIEYSAEMGEERALQLYTLMTNDPDWRDAYESDVATLLAFYEDIETDYLAQQGEAHD